MEIERRSRRIRIEKGRGGKTEERMRGGWKEENG
jgi:hypothetical protein